MLLFYATQFLCTMFTCSPVYVQTFESIVPEFYPSGQPRSIEHAQPEEGNSGPSLDARLPVLSENESHRPDFSSGIGAHVALETNPIVWIQDGGLQGFTMKTLSGKSFAAFQNIPFAQPPIGPLRFHAPLKNVKWKNVREAMSPSSTCLQTDFMKLYNITGTEDCLYLNVYTPKIPKSSEKLNIPVMIFIHGGGFFFGGSNLYGPTYMMEEKVVLVSMNYRLGPFGFLSTGDKASPGNNGLKDQSLALKWVHDNIEQFGGDPNRVTIFGESAGAGSVQFHMLSPLSKGLFHGGISESGCTFCFWSISEKAKQLTRDFAKLYNCNQEKSEELVECLRQVDGNVLVKGQLKFIQWNAYPVVVFGPVIEPKHDGAFLDDLPANIYARGESAQVPWITGFNSDEGALNIASILADPTSLPEINEDWDRVGPVFLELHDATEHPKRMARSIREYYLGDRNVSFDTRHEAVKMFSDRYMIVCASKSIQHHAKMNRQPVYAYHFNYMGSYGVVNLIGQKTEDWGVSHLDDLIYLMNNTAYYPTLKLTDEEYKVSRLIVNIWVNFARTGKPFQTTENGTEVHFWNPVSKNATEMQYLELNLEPEMVPNPFTERLNFWKSLNLKEDESQEEQDLTPTNTHSIRIRR